MEIIFAILALVSTLAFIGFVIGMFKPQVVKCSSKRNAALIFGGIWIISGLLGAFVNPNSDKDIPEQENVVKVARVQPDGTIELNDSNVFSKVGSKIEWKSKALGYCVIKAHFMMPLVIYLEGDKKLNPMTEGALAGLVYAGEIKRNVQEYPCIGFELPKDEDKSRDSSFCSIQYSTARDLSPLAAKESDWNDLLNNIEHNRIKHIEPIEYKDIIPLIDYLEIEIGTPGKTQKYKIQSHGNEREVFLTLLGWIFNVKFE